MKIAAALLLVVATFALAGCPSSGSGDAKPAGTGTAAAATAAPAGTGTAAATGGW